MLILLRGMFIEGTVAVTLSLVFFAGFLALLAVVFPVGQDLRILLQSDRQRDRSSASLVRGGDVSSAGAVAEYLASLEVVHPSVRKRRSGAIAWTQASTGSRFGIGDGIQTGSDGRALVQIGVAQIRLENNSLVILGLEAQQSADRTALWRASPGLAVIQGEVAATIEGGAENTFTLALPTGMASVRGTDSSAAEVLVSVDPNRASTVTSVRGSVSMESNGRRVEIAERQFVRVEKNGALSEPLHVPDAPMLQSPADGATYPFVDLPPRIRFDWRPATGPGEWRLVVARDDASADVVVDERVTANALDWGRLGPGRYKWYVVRLQEGVSSTPSASRTLVVSGASQSLLLTVDPPPARVDGLLCVIRGKTVPGATVYVVGRPAEVSSDGRFEVKVALDPGANIVLVEAVAAGGQNVHSTHVIHAKP